MGPIFVFYNLLNILKLNNYGFRIHRCKLPERSIASDQLSVIDFWAEWCGPCRAIGPVIEELSKEYNGKVKIGKVNVDNNPQLSINYGITSIPAILFVKNGEVVDKLVGAQPKANFVKKIEAHI